MTMAMTMAMTMTMTITMTMVSDRAKTTRNRAESSIFGTFRTIQDMLFK
jgi:hypothetical protein